MSVLQIARPWPGLICLLFLLCACSNPYQSRLLLDQPPAHLPALVELTGVAFFPGQDYQCGPATLATVLNYQGIEVSTGTLADQVYIPDQQGSLQIEMIAAARQHGMVVYPLAPGLEALLSEIAAGNPVLVFQNLGLDWLPRWHYAVAMGYDLEEGILILRSGDLKRRLTPLTTFEQTWKRAGYWAQVILPPGRLPATARPLPYTRAVYALEITGKQQAALTAYRMAAKHWADKNTVLLTWGNAEYSAGNFPQAQSAFRQALQSNPQSLAAWNNLAYALSAMHCNKEAKQAIDCARHLSPDDKNIQDSVRDLNRSHSTQRENCQPVHCTDP